MKEIFWSEVGGAATAGAVVATIKSGKVLPNVKDLDLIVAGTIVVADALASDHMGPVGSGIGNGMAAYSVGYIAQSLLNKTVLKPGASSTSSATTAPVQVLYTNPTGATSSSSGSSATSTSTTTASTMTAYQPATSGVESQSTN